MARNDTFLIYDGYKFSFHVQWKWQENWIADTNSMKPQNGNVLGFVSNCECDHKYNFD